MTTKQLIDEINSFDLQKDDNCKIEIVAQCPFTLEEQLSIKNAVVVDINAVFTGSNFKNCFLYVDNYGKDVYIPFESAKILNKNTKDFHVSIQLKENEPEIMYCYTLEEAVDFLKKHDSLSSNILFFYKNIEVGILKVSYYDMFGKKYPQFKIEINEDSLDIIFDVYYEAPLGDEWDWQIYKFKELANTYLFMDGDYLSSYEFLYNEELESMSKEEISQYLMKNHF